ncbi:MAG: 3'(2'),5'-bisphosphate nucleotidase [Phycisphaerales bacterium]
MADYGDLLDAATRAVGAACALCRQVQGNMGQMRAILKDDRSPVTIADFGAQALVGHILRERLGDPVHMVGEETSAFLRNPENGTALAATLVAVQEVWPEAGETGLLDAIDVGAGDTDHEGFWTLDPIDGTKGFLRGGQYAVSLAYIERGQVVVAAMGCPNLSPRFDDPFDRPHRHGCLYSAIRGQGTHEVPADQPLAHPVKLLRARREEGQPLTLCTSVEEAHSSQERTAEVMARVGRVGEPAKLDSQAKYAVVARGQADAYLRIPTKAEYAEYIWDHAAGALIAMEAGCAVTDIDGKPLDFSAGRRLTGNRGILAGMVREHGLIQGAIRGLGI